MLEILSITGPIYLAIAAGHLSVRFGLFARGDVRVMGSFVISIALPCLLFGALIHRPVMEVLNPTYLVGYAGAILVTASLGGLWAWRVRGLAPTASVIVAMGMACPNSGFVGFPVMMLTLPAVAGQVLAMNLVIENLIALPLLMTLADQASGTGLAWHRALAQSAARLARNPLVIAMVAGLAVTALGIPVPVVVDRTATLFAQVSGGLSLFAIGASLGGGPGDDGGREGGMRRLIADVAPITAGKLLLQPVVAAMVLAGLAAIGLPALGAELHTALILSTAMPMLSIYPIVALRHGHAALASAAVVITTLATAVTLTLVIWAIRQHLPILTG